MQVFIRPGSRGTAFAGKPNLKAPLRIGRFQAVRERRETVYKRSIIRLSKTSVALAGDLVYPLRMTSRKTFGAGVLGLCLLAGALSGAEPAGADPREAAMQWVLAEADKSGEKGAVRGALAAYLEAFSEAHPDRSLAEEIGVMRLRLRGKGRRSPQEDELLKALDQAFAAAAAEPSGAEIAGGWWARWFDGQARRGDPPEEEVGGGRLERYLSLSPERLVHPFALGLRDFHAWLFSGRASSPEKEAAFAAALRPPAAAEEDWLPEDVLAAADRALRE